MGPDGKSEQVADADSGGGAQSTLPDQLHQVVRALNESHERILGFLEPRIETARRLEAEATALRMDNWRLTNWITAAAHKQSCQSPTSIGSCGSNPWGKEPTSQQRVPSPCQSVQPVSAPPTLQPPNVPIEAPSLLEPPSSLHRSFSGGSHSSNPSLRQISGFTAGSHPSNPGLREFESEGRSEDSVTCEAMQVVLGRSSHSSSRTPQNPQTDANGAPLDWKKAKPGGNGVDAEFDSEQGIMPGLGSASSRLKKQIAMYNSNDSIPATPPTNLGPASRPALTHARSTSIITPTGSARSSRKSEPMSVLLRDPTSTFSIVGAFGEDENGSQDSASSRAYRIRKFQKKHQGSFSSTSQACVFPRAEVLKEKVRSIAFKRESHVTDLYHAGGCWRSLATNTRFEQFTQVVIAVNAIWIAVETELNDEALLTRSPIVFQLMEHFFCAYFLFECLVRFMAFQRKKDCFLDKWFIFDTFLVSAMILETWVMTVIIALTSAGTMNTSDGGLGNASVLRIVRLLRLLRMSRVGKLCRLMPELMILIKGMAVAIRTVCYTLFLLMIIVYVFAIAFMQLTKGTEMQEMYFKTVLGTMGHLLMEGILPDQANFMRRMSSENFLLAAALLLFILLGSLTVMNMLVGVLVEVVQNVSAIEKEQMDVAMLKNNLMKYVNDLDTDRDGNISRLEFEKILEIPGPLRALQNIGVDVIGLVDFTDYIFEEEEMITFRKFMEVILQLRGTNTAMVKDIVDLRKYLALELTRVEKKLTRTLHAAIHMAMHHHKDCS